jgi:hypothetical protein
VANNRAYLVCDICAIDESISREDTIFFLFKYYPNTGWYLPQATEEKLAAVGPRLNAWLDKHVHGGRYGEFVRMVFESALGDPMVADKRAILDSVASATLKEKP